MQWSRLDDHARQLAADYYGLAVKIAGEASRRRRGLDYERMKSAAAWGLMRAAALYPGDGRREFGSYAANGIRAAIRDDWIAESRAGMIGVDVGPKRVAKAARESAEAIDRRPSTDPARAAAVESARERIAALLPRIPEPSRSAITDYLAGYQCCFDAAGMPAALAHARIAAGRLGTRPAPSPSES